MILDTLLESTNSIGGYSIEAPEAIVRNYYTPDLTGMMHITNESFEDFMKLDEAVMLFEQTAFQYKLSGDNGKYEHLTEGVVADFFQKAVDLLKRMWAKVSGFFKNLFVQITGRVRDLDKFLESHNEDLSGNKKFTKFEYKMYPWKDASPAAEINSKAVKCKDDAEKALDAAMAHLDKTKTASDESINISNKLYESRRTTARFVNFLVNGTADKDLAIAEAKTEIAKSYRGEKEEDKKGAPELSKMVTFMKTFEKNKVLNECKKTTDELFKSAIAKAEQAKSKVQAGVDEKDGGAGKKAAHSQTLPLVKLELSNLTNCLAAYDQVMAILIDLEKEKFADYRKVVFAAIQHSE